MGTLTDFATDALAEHVFITAYSPPATLYLALCTATIDAQDVANTNITETTYTSYARTAITFAAAGSRTVIQTAGAPGDVDFPQATGADVGPITDWAILDSASGAGNVLAFGVFNSSFAIQTNNTPKVAGGKIEIDIGASGSAGFTDIAVHRMLNLMFRNTAWTSPATGNELHLGVTTAIIADANAMTDITEATGGSYAREPVPASSFASSGSGVITTDTIITFDAPSGDWSGGSNITSLFVVDDLSGTAGDLLAFDNGNVVDQSVGLGDTVNIQVGDFDIDLD